MFCSHCGKQGTGNFCTQCGKRLLASEEAEGVISPFTHEGMDLSDWRTEHLYNRLIECRPCKSFIERAAANSRKRQSAEDFLKSTDKLVAPLTGGISANSVGNAIQTLTTSFGISMERSQTVHFQCPIGVLIVAALGTLARNSQSIRWVEQLADGIEVDTELPSDMFSLTGDMKLRMVSDAPGSVLQATSKIHGQLFDLGKSSRALKQLLEEIRRSTEQLSLET